MTFKFLINSITVFVCFFSTHLLAQTQIIAHRGASFYETENSIAAFKKAFLMQADAIELDIWRTADDSLMVMHDRTTGRTSNKELVMPTSTARELRSLKLNNGERIPYLSEAIATVPKGKKIVIEIKCCWEAGDAGNVFPMLKNILERSGRLNDAIIIAFNINTIADAKQQLPGNKCYYLTGQKEKEDELIEACKKFNLDGLNVHYSILTESLAEKSRKAGLDLLVWTVDNPVEAINARLKNKVIAITTNKPDLIRDVLSQNNYETLYYEQKKSIFEMLPNGTDEIIFLGNSITDVGEWSEFFQNSKIKNRGISGDITLGVLARLDEVIESKPAKIFLMIGINDIANDIHDSIILINYQRILREIQAKSPKTKVFVQSILPTNKNFVKLSMHQNKTEHILYLNEKLKEICKQNNLTYIDVFSAIKDDNNELNPIYTNDGLHLMASGYKVWTEILKPYVNEVSPSSTIKFENPYYLTRLKAHRAETIPPNSVIFIGNSITEQGWWSILLKNNKIVNRGIGGDNTLGILNRLPEILQAKPKKIFLMTGINDITAGRSIDEIAANIEKMVDMIESTSPETILYIQSVLPINDDCLAYEGLKGKNSEVVMLNMKLRDLCKKRNVNYINIAPLLSDEKGSLKATLTKDGIHLLPEGYVIWTNYLKKMKYLR
ncbi:MAG: GDSL-type esterase/lipase family protein [Paludibacter sp.]|nr:GDSL-type esterase/lipase family protein [Paludibacter sp.]